MICPRCSFQNPKGTLACARCGEAPPRPLTVLLDSRPPEDGPRPGAKVPSHVPINRRGGGLRAFSGGPAAYPSPRNRPAPPRWERSPRAAAARTDPPMPAVIGAAAISTIHQERTDPQWIVPPQDDVEDDTPDRTESSGDDVDLDAIRPSVFGRRAVAALVDAVVVSLAAAASIALGLLVFGWHALAPQFARGVDYVIDGLLIGRGLAPIFLGLILVVGFAYTTVAHALAGATLGKVLLGLRVSARDGRAPKPGESAWRSILTGISLGLAGMGIAVAIVDPNHVALHDRIVGTRVGRRRPVAVRPAE